MKALLFALLCATAAATHAEQVNAGSDWLVFLSAEIKRPYGIDASRLSDPQGEFVAQIVFNHSYGVARVLVESELSNDDAGIDRFQVGWQVGEDNTLWLGKFHQPASAWSFGHDHGHYLETAIIVPSVEEWEDEAGLLPHSAVGALWDSEHRIGSAASWQFSAAAGFTPLPNREDSHRYWMPLVPEHSGSVSWSARAAYCPTYLEETRVGVLLGRQALRFTRLADAALSAYQEGDESVYGIFADWARARWRAQSSVYDVNLILRGSAGQRSEHFIAGFAQIERQWNHHLTVFARREDFSRIQNSQYAAAFGDHLTIARSAAGVRWDATRHQAYTLEAARSRTIADRYTEVHLQWSALVQ